MSRGSPGAGSWVVDAASVDAVIFDMDGVLTDTARVHQAAWSSVLDRVLSDIAPDAERFGADDYRRYVDGRNRSDGVRVFLAARGIALPVGGWTVAAVAESKDAAFASELGRTGITVFQDSVRLLQRLRDSGFRLAVATASHHRSAVLDSVGLDKLFDAHVDGFDIDELGLSGKPDPAIFLEAARRLGVSPSRAAVFEDAVPGIQAARAGNFAFAIGVDRAGIGPSLRDAGATVVVESLDQVSIRGV